jgi:multidrug efflux system membrane fusion protein
MSGNTMTKPVIRIIVGAALAGAVLSGFLYFYQLSVMPRTDDAYVAADVVQIAAQVEGPIVKSPLQNNAAVKKGDLLFEIDPKPFQIAVDHAKAALAQTRQDVASLTDAVKTAEAAVTSAKAGVAAAEAAVKSTEAALDNATTTFERQKKLVQQGATSKQKVEDAEAAFKEARAANAQAKSGLNQATAELDQAKAKLAQAQDELGPPGDANPRILLAKATLADAELNLSYTTVTAVEDGFVSGLNLPPGNYVSVGEPLFTLVTTDTWRITGNFLETDIGRIKSGQKAVIRLQTYPDHRLEGIVEGISWGIEQEAGDVERGGLPNVTPTVDWVRLAQRFPVKVKFVDVPPEVELRIGMNGNVLIDTTADTQ